MDRIDELFGQEEPRLFPGSRHQIPDSSPTPRKRVAAPGAWDEHPIIHRVKGVEVEFFTIGMMAQALGRSAATLREWEATGVLPPARFRTASKDPKKARRLYTRAHVEGVAKIAQEEGLMASARAGGLRRARIPLSFVDRVRELFKSLEGT